MERLPIVLQGRKKQASRDSWEWSGERKSHHTRLALLVTCYFLLQSSRACSEGKTLPVLPDFSRNLINTDRVSLTPVRVTTSIFWRKWLENLQMHFYGWIDGVLLSSCFGRQSKIGDVRSFFYATRNWWKKFSVMRDLIEKFSVMRPNYSGVQTPHPVYDQNGQHRYQIYDQNYWKTMSSLGQYKPM